MVAMSDPGAYWLLIAVLQSSVQLDQAVAMRLYRAALSLHAASASVEKIQGDLASGEVRRLGKTMLIGAIGGPAFEADLDTPRGSGKVRFVLTDEGLAQADAAPHRSASLLN